jgi:Dolichyl-phosphate-mannose-protein mannosyltransferase
MTAEDTKPSRLPIYLLSLVCGLSVALGVVRAASIPFWFDEIYTARIAVQPTWKATFVGTQTLDLNPPLEAFLAHASSLAFGPHELAIRLPSIFGFTLMAGCLFILLWRRASPWFAAFGSLLLIQNVESFYYATEARPYALLLGMLGVALIGYDAILQESKNSRWWRVVLLIGMTGIVLSHAFSIFPVAAFLLAELMRTIRQRRIDILTWLALLLPLGFCVLYRPLLQSHGVMFYPPSQRATLTAAFRLYIYLFTLPIARVLVAALVLLLFCRNYPKSKFLAWLRMPAEELLLLLLLLATPVSVALVMLWKSPASGYYARYGVELLYPGLFFLVAWMAWRSYDDTKIAQLLTVLVLVAMIFTYKEVPGEARHLMHHGWLSAPDEAASTGGVAALYPELPLVANDGLEFLEADNRLSSADLARFYYLTDTPTAMRITQSNALEGLPALQSPFHIRGHFAPLGTFTAEHRDFLVIGEINRSTSWLMKWAMEQKAEIQYLGDYKYAGQKMPLWRVTLKPAGA